MRYRTPPHIQLLATLDVTLLMSQLWVNELGSNKKEEPDHVTDVQESFSPRATSGGSSKSTRDDEYFIRDTDMREHRQLLLH